MPSLPPELYHRCRELFLRCSEFENYQSLRSVFVTDQLSPFRSRIPMAANNPNDLVSQCLPFLLEQNVSDGSPLFLIFVQVLSNLYHVGDQRHNELQSLYHDAKMIWSLAETDIAAINAVLDKKFDVFLCHNSKDKPAVKSIGQQLIERGIKPWLDEWDVIPLTSWQDELQKVISEIKAVAVFIGPSGIGPWEDIEIKVFLDEFARRELRIGLVLLPGCTDKPQVPLFMRNFKWVDFRVNDPNPLDQLIWGITGDKNFGTQK